MRQVRVGTFETNSSSTHSITMCSDSEYQAWESGKLLHVEDSWGSDSEYAKKDFVTFDEARDIILKNRYAGVSPADVTDDFIREHGHEYSIYTYDYFFENYRSGLEYYVETHTTPGGEKVVAFGMYGYDG